MRDAEMKMEKYTKDGNDGYGKLSREWRGGREMMMMALLEGCRAIKMDEKWEMSGERI